MKKIIILILLILIMGCSTCFGASAYSLTFSEFKEIIEKNGFTLDSSVTASNLNNALNYSPLIIKNCNYYYNNDKYENYLCIFYSNRIPNFHYSANVNSSYSTIRLVNSSFNDWTSLDAILLGYNSDNILHFESYTGYHNLEYSNYSDFSTTTTSSEYQSASFQKKLLSEKVLYYEGPIYLNYTKTDLMYKFDGVFKGNDTQSPYSSSFNIDYEQLNFNYTAYTDLENSNVVNYFFLQEFLPNQVVNLTEKDLNFTDSDELLLTNKKLNTSFTFNYLAKKMQDGYIYRLYCFSNQHNESGELLRITDSTSCFFSLNSWESNLITVVNINKYLGGTSDDIILIPDNNNSTDNGAGTGNGTNNSFDIQGSLDNISNNFDNTILGTPDESGERQGGLLGGLLDGLIGLFIPDSDFFFNDVSGDERGYFNQIQDFFSEHLGFLFFPFDFTIDIINRFSNSLSEDSEAVWKIPDIYFPNFQNESDEPFFKGFELNPKKDLIEKDERIQNFYNIYLSLMDGLLVIVVIWLAERKWKEVSKS